MTGSCSLPEVDLQSETNLKLLIRAALRQEKLMSSYQERSCSLWPLQEVGNILVILQASMMAQFLVALSIAVEVQAEISGG